MEQNAGISLFPGKIIKLSEESFAVFPDFFWKKGKIVCRNSALIIRNFYWTGFALGIIGNFFSNLYDRTVLAYVCMPGIWIIFDIVGFLVATRGCANFPDK